jgi:hypothetical protein
VAQRGGLGVGRNGAQLGMRRAGEQGGCQEETFNELHGWRF